MTKFVYDGVAGATPLAVLKPGGEAEGAVKLLDMFIGRTGGVIGETSVLFLLIGAIYLLVRKVISIRIPAAYILTFAVLIFLFAPGHQFDVLYTAEQICGGGLILGAFFMATDYVTSPITPNGKIVFGVILGLDVYKRQTEMCTPVCCSGVNFRREKAQEKMERLKKLMND